MWAALLGFLCLVCSTEAEAGAADVGVLVGGDAADGSGAVEADV